MGGVCYEKSIPAHLYSWPRLCLQPRLTFRRCEVDGHLFLLRGYNNLAAMRRYCEILRGNATARVTISHSLCRRRSLPLTHLAPRHITISLPWMTAISTDLVHSKSLARNVCASERTSSLLVDYKLLSSVAALNQGAPGQMNIHRPGSAPAPPRLRPAYCFASVIVWTENKNVTMSDRLICFILTVKQSTALADCVLKKMTLIFESTTLKS